MKVVHEKKIYLDKTDIESIINQHFHNQYPEAIDITAEVGGKCNGYDELDAYGIATIEME